MWTEAKIQNALTCDCGAYPHHRYLCVPNVSWGFMYTGEADLLAVSSRGYINEIEIKISMGDLKRDKNKDKFKHYGYAEMKVNRLYYAMPLDMAESSIIYDYIPEYAGLYGMYYGQHGDIRFKALRAAKLLHKEKITDEDRIQLYRLLGIRYWNKRHKGIDK